MLRNRIVAFRIDLLGAQDRCCIAVLGSCAGHVKVSLVIAVLVG